MVHIIKPAPDPEVIEYLEELLGQAKSGELQAFACVKYFNDNVTSNGWCSFDKNPRLIMSEVLIMQNLMADHYVQAEKRDMEE